MQTDPTREIEKRTQRYWYEDGIWEIGFGLANALLGGFYFVTGRLDWKGPQALVLALMQMVFLVGVFWLIGPIVKFFKERITYPRTGFVSYRKPTTRSRLFKIVQTALLAAAVAAFVGVLAAMRVAPNRMALIIAVILGSALVYLGYRFELLRLYFAAALTVLWGYLVSRYPLSDTQSTAVFFAGFGSLVLLSGLATLLIYLRRSRPVSGLDDYEAPDGSTDEQ